MKALIAMSGGVDSSVAAWLVRQEGYEAVGCTMKLFDGAVDGPAGKRCCTLDDAEDARSVAYRIGLPFYVFNYTEEFRKQVIGRFADSYLHGLTPNPCIDCNHFLKFGALLERARMLGCDRIATGHYARVGKDADGRFLLKKARSAEKDQSYVLYELTQAQLARTLLPLGGLTKAEVRAFAAEQGFLNAQKRESQDICFAPDGDYASVIERLTGRASEPGDFVDRTGRVLGRHRGVIHYTVGQHRGLELYYHEALYVVAIDAARNTVTLGPKEALFSDTATADGVNWIVGETPAQPFRCTAKIRYRAPEVPVTVTPLGADRMRLDFDAPQRAITPGQAAVLYDGETVLGGGRFER